MTKKKESGPASIAQNKKARFDYFIEDRLEAGVALQGWEVKSMRAGKGQLTDSFVIFRDGEAWLGLAACSDRIRRFDLADHAYRQAHRLIGSTPEYYNNIGYSYLLRGDLQQARTAFLKAYELKPDDPTINNNLRLLKSSVASIQR